MPSTAKLGVGLYPQRQELIARRCLGQLQVNGGTQRQQYLLAFAVNGCFGSIVACRMPAASPRRRNGRHHLAGHPRGEGVVDKADTKKAPPGPPQRVRMATLP